jgi:SAM-dependent methyltransferase
MWAFQLFSLAELPPLLGLIIGLSALFLLVEDRFERYFVVAVALITIAAVAPKISLQPYEGPTTFWSPYQKLTLSPIYPTKTQLPGGYYLEVNNTGYMGLLDLNDKHEATASAILVENRFALPSELPFLNQYTLPYRFKPAPDNVLIIGAGAGNDANGAIRGGAKSIDAVEIDPLIIRLGKQYHPNQPYQNPAVNTVVADGRAFMERTQIRYDLIVMGLADSHTLSSNLTNLRLDHYLYTRESLARAREILKPDGILILSFEAPRPWIGQRLAKTVADAFGSPPLVFEVRSDSAFGWGGYFFVAAKDPNLLPRLLNNNPELANFIKEHEKSFFPLTINALSDDWPYLYLDKPRLPLIHILMALFLTGTLLVVKSRFLRASEFNLPMFLWGAAFLLFEFQNISKAGLLFGLTWQTNMIIITSVLLMILLANFIAERKLLKPNLAFIGLIGSLGLQLIIPLYKFNQLSTIAKLVGAGTILNLPFFFGAVIFAYWFVNAKNRSAAFASNLLGSAFGGLLEMMSFLTGIKSLLLVTIALYFLGWITASRKFGKIIKL